MKDKTFPFLFGLMLTTNVFGQNWAPFQFDRHYYISMSTVTTAEPKVSFKKGEILNLLVDSKQDQLFFPRLTAGCDLRDKNASCYGTGESCSDLFSFVGSPVSMQDSFYSTMNRNDELINLNLSHLVDTLLIKSDTYYLSHFVHAEVRNIKGAEDSVAIYTIEVMDTNGIVSGSIWHGDTIVLSKSNGFIKFPSWYLFPDYKAWFELFEHPLTSDFKAVDIYPYQLGNVLHFSLTWEVGNQQPYNTTYKKHVLRQCTVTMVDSTSLSERFQVAQLQKISEKFYNDDYPYALDSSFEAISNDTIWWPANVAFTFDKNFIKWNYSLTQDNEHLEIHRDATWIGAPSLDCPWRQEQFEHSDGNVTTIRVGIGEIEHHSYHLDNFPLGPYNRHTRELVYYKSQDQEYGNPTWPIGLEEVNLSSLQVFPNPTENQIAITSDKPLSKIEIFNSHGVLIRSFPKPNSTSAEIQLSGLPSGLYFLRIKTEKETVTKRIIKTAD